MSWKVETQIPSSGRWHPLVTDSKSYCEGLYAGLTDYTRTTSKIRLVNGKGEVVQETSGRGGIQVGMTSTPHPKAAWEQLAIQLLRGLDPIGLLDRGSDGVEELREKLTALLK